MQTTFPPVARAAAGRLPILLPALLLAACATPLPPAPPPAPRPPVLTDAERYPAPQPRTPPAAAAELPAPPVPPAAPRDAPPLSLAAPAAPAALPPLAEPPGTPPATAAARPAAAPLAPKVAVPPPAPRAAVPPPAAAAAPAATGRWAVQVGVFAVAANAETIRNRVAQQLAGAGLAASDGVAELVQRDGRTHVLVGDLPDRAAAQRLATRLRGLLKQDVLLFQR